MGGRGAGGYAQQLLPRCAGCSLPRGRHSIARHPKLLSNAQYMHAGGNRANEHANDR